MRAAAAERRSRLGRTLALAGALAIAAAACAAPVDEVAPPADPPEASPPPAAPTAPPDAGPPGADPGETAEPPDREDDVRIEQGLEGLVARAVQDLAERSGASPEDIQIVRAQSIVWPDASRGCPHPDMRYTQVPVDGALIELRLDGRTHRYHSGGADPEPFLCEQPAKTPPPATLDPTVDPGANI